MKARLAAAAAALLILLPFLAAGASGSLDAKTHEALLAALEDERRSHALYEALADRFGDDPFRHVADSEARHAAHLIELFGTYGLPVPADRWTERAVDVPATRQEACRVGVESERTNVAMYEGFLHFVQEPDIRATFERLAAMSKGHHLRAFERCAEGSAMGPGRGGHGGGTNGEAAAGGCGGKDRKGAKTEKHGACGGGCGCCGGHGGNGR